MNYQITNLKKLKIKVNTQQQNIVLLQYITIIIKHMRNIWKLWWISIIISKYWLIKNIKHLFLLGLIYLVWKIFLLIWAVFWKGIDCLNLGNVSLLNWMLLVLLFLGISKPEIIKINLKSKKYS